MKLGILIVSFGTTYPGTRAKNIGKITECVRECYPDALIREAVSSSIVRRVMQKKELLPALNTEEALKQLCEAGATHVVVLPTHIIDGIENSKMKQSVQNCRGLFEKIQIADVLLAQPEDYRIAAKALWESMKDTAGADPVIFMGHGTTHEADRSYQKMECALQEYAKHPVYMATVEGSVTIEDVVRKMEHKKTRVVVVPFMLVAGDHATNDMAGEEDSFASRLREEGFEPECIIRGIGEYPALREIYLEHLRRAMEELGIYEEMPGNGTQSGILYGIGVGPGDPQLLTLKAVRTIRSCDVLVLPSVSREECYAYRIAVQEIPEIDSKPVRCMPFPMIRDAAKLELAHRAIYETIESYIRQGKRVGLLTIGDPTIYSTYMYMHHRVVENGLRAEIISGVPSFCAAAARLGISLGEKKDEIHIVPASYDIEDTLHYTGTRIYMKSGRRLKELAEALRQQQQMMQDQNVLEVYAVSNCGMQDEKIYYGLDQIQQAEGYLTLVIVKNR